MDKITIRVENLNKKFRIFHEPTLTFQKAVYNFLKGRRAHQDILALKNVNFSLNRQEVVGLIGPNASGKTTLLKVIANIYVPTSGLVRVQGKVAAFFELGSGFLTEFTGIENLYLYGAVLGLSRKEIRDKIPQITRFCELKDFLDIPLRQYSSGMKTRLASSLAVNLDPDILLIDETLAADDLSFREKFFKKVKELKEKGKTLLLVSHNMDEIQRLCDRVIFLDKGQIKIIGPPQEVIREYKTIMQGRV